MVCSEVLEHTESVFEGISVRGPDGHPQPDGYPDVDDQLTIFGGRQVGDAGPAPSNLTALRLGYP